MSTDGENLQRWHTIMNDHKTEYESIVDEMGQLAGRMDTATLKTVSAGQEVFKQRDVLMDKAFEMLAAFVGDLTKYPVGDAEIGSEGVPSLSGVVESFQRLAEYCESVVDQEGLEAVESTQEIGENGQIAERVRNFQQRLASDMNGLAGAIAEGEGLFDTNHGHHMDARAALSTAESRKSDFFYTVFGDRGIDRAVNDCRANEEHWHRVADEAWANKENLRSLHQRLQPVLGNDLEGLVRNLGRLADQMRANYAKIGEDRTVDNDCWIAARTLQYHVATNTEYTNRDDALRHVLKLLSTANKTIAADSDVARLKQGMKKQIQDKLGVAKAAELEQEKTFLAKPEDVDF